MYVGGDHYGEALCPSPQDMMSSGKMYIFHGEFVLLIKSAQFLFVEKPRFYRIEDILNIATIAASLQQTRPFQPVQSLFIAICSCNSFSANDRDHFPALVRQCRFRGYRIIFLSCCGMVTRKVEPGRGGLVNSQPPHALFKESRLS